MLCFETVWGLVKRRDWTLQQDKHHSCCVSKAWERIITIYNFNFGVIVMLWLFLQRKDETFSLDSFFFFFHFSYEVLTDFHLYSLEKLQINIIYIHIWKVNIIKKCLINVLKKTNKILIEHALYSLISHS